MPQRDYYEILGLPRNASPDDVKSAFRKLARQYHPDVSQEPNAEERFKEINEAYAVLSEPEKRAAYDRFGHAGVQNMGGVPDFTVDFADLFEEFFGGFGGFGRTTSRRTRNAPRRGGDLQYNVDLTFEESIFGVEREIEITRDEVCETCGGSRAEPGTSRVRCSTCNGAGEVRQVRQTLLGSMVQVSTCPVCNGQGETIATPCHTCSGRGLVRKIRKKVVSIPAGVDNGNQIRLAGEGQPGENGGPNGNLYLVVRVLSHKYFRRRESDILLDLDINIAQAALGAEVDVPTVDGPTKLKIPAAIQPGKVLRMRGKGVPHLRGNGRGDQMVVVNVEIPKNLTPEQRELMEELAKSLGSEVKPAERGFLEWLKDTLGG
ncbi:MAG: molecular chaperone DnaJ [Chloroflexi bacterium RBG_13_50_21]|nr:MAG: molecular chaperone DnaJ [Chloroflexi bacterium RBG_13_50_21]OGO64646.1 MAG: molecular chaperone DnaJ [Chloroflexi bacterium RBG_19FT_COMBO_47_9]